MKPYMVIAATGRGDVKREIVAHNPVQAREKMRRWLGTQHRAHGEIAVFERLDPKEEAKQHAHHAVAFNEFYRDDVIIF